MGQTQQYKKVKLYRNLKVAFYMLGLPLFLLAVFFSAVRFLGHDPFMGTTEVTSDLGFFQQLESYITAPALYGVWIGFGVWAFITIVHVVLSYTVKNARVRMLAVIATCLVVMLGTGLVLDVVYEAKVADLQEQYANTSVTIDDYKTQLSYYRNVSSNAASKSYTNKLIEQIALLKEVYNVEMEGLNKSGDAGNISNKPITYYNVIWENPENKDEVIQGVDICYEQNPETGLYELAFEDKEHNILKSDNDLAQILDHTYRVSGSSVYAEESSIYDYKKSPEYQTIITLAPNANGQLEINGKVYTHYWCQAQETHTRGIIYTWYCKDLMPVGTQYGKNSGASVTIQDDGIWGRGVYNSNGLLGDGWVYSLENVLKILEDYYSSESFINASLKKGDEYNTLYQNAVEARHAYYTGQIEDPEGHKASAFEQQLYLNENDFTERFSMTSNGLDYIIAKLGAMLGDNALFDFVLGTGEPDQGLGDINIGDINIGSMLSGILDKLAVGMSFTEFGMDADTLATTIEWIGALTGCSAKDLANVTGLYLVVSYKNEKCTFEVGEGMYIALVAGYDEGEGSVMGTDSGLVKDGGDVFVDIVLDDSLVSVDEDGNVEYDFDLDHLNDFINIALNGLMDKFSLSLEGLITGNGSDTMATIGQWLGPNGKLSGLISLIKTFDIDGDTYYGFEISGVKIPLINEEYEFNVDIKAILLDLIGSMYNYQSPCIKPVWEFFTWNCGDKQELASAYTTYYRAQYQAVIWGSTIGSTLIGDELGDGTYPSSLGLGDLESVQQLMADLSYKPYFYPVYAVRDMLFLFTGLVVLFYYLSFVCAQKEEDYATGNIVAKERKHGKKASADDSNSDAMQNISEGENVSEGDAILPSDQNNKGGAVK